MEILCINNDNNERFKYIKGVFRLINSIFYVELWDSVQ